MPKGLEDQFLIEKGGKQANEYSRMLVVATLSVMTGQAPSALSSAAREAAPGNEALVVDSAR